jgi:hypothetical protein
MFHLLNDKSLLQKLRDELETLPPVEGHAYPYAQLKALPYLVITPQHHSLSRFRDKQSDTKYRQGLSMKAFDWHKVLQYVSHEWRLRKRFITKTGLSLRV